MTVLPRLTLAALLLASTLPAMAVTRPAKGPEVSYVLGRYAAASDDLAEAARYFDAARRQDGSDPALTRRTFELAIAAGNAPLAVALANQLAASGQGDPTVALIRLTDALQRRDWNAADAARAGLASAGYAAVVGPIVNAWTLQGRGRTDAAIAVLDPSKFEGFARSYVTEHRAMLLANAGRYDAAAADYATLLASVGANVARVRIAAAATLQADGHVTDAARTLGDDADPQLAAARARLAAGTPVGSTVTLPRTGVAWLAARLAADLAREKPVPLSLVFARVATFLAPDAPETWMIAGDVLARSRRDDAALAAYAHIMPGDLLAPVARARRAQVLGDAGRDAEARALLTTAATAKDATGDDWARLGDVQRKGEHYAEAARAYSRGIDRAGSPEAAGWTLYFLRGSAFEQAGDWARAEPDLRTALRLAPQEPVVLNYLGYSLLDRGLKTAEAQALIETAAKLRPDDGAITDSLGWAYYRTGQFDRAAGVLERAVLAEPGDPAVNDHYGDALWRTGRRLEARFYWRTAIDLGIAPAQVAAVRAKLDYGLDVALTQATAAH